jgi:ribosomal protein S18 acetylase RimI-like enzyme
VVAVRKLLPRDIDDVVARIARRLRDDANLKELINPAVSADLLRQALASSTSSTWIAHDEGRIVGHLYGALLEHADYGTGAWIGPDGVSFDDDDALASLYTAAGEEWIAAHAREHFVWTLDDPSTTSAWIELGFSKMHARGVKVLRPGNHQLSDEYVLRRGTLDDLELAVQLDDELDRAQSEGPSFAIGLSTASRRDDWTETLSDLETNLYIVNYRGAAVAQCVTFALPAQRSSFDRTIHLSAVVVRAEHRRRGIASAMIDAAFNDAMRDGFEFGETIWRLTNRQATRYWKNYGFETTYVRLHRTIGPY